MSGITDLIDEKRKESPVFNQLYQEEERKLKAGFALKRLREEKGLSQRELAEIVGKPQSTIVRIENGNMNATIKLLDEIAEKLDKKLEIHFV